MAAKKKAPAVRKKKSKIKAFPSDAESIVLRQENAAREKAPVKRLETGGDPFFGTFEVASTQWANPYVVEIRSLTEPLNTCTCQDHRMNRLGTCKHVERVLIFLAHRRKRAFRAAAQKGAATYEVFFDVRTRPVCLTLLRPTSVLAEIEKRIGPLFGEDGRLLGTATDAWPVLERELTALSLAQRSAVRLSRDRDYWLSRERTALRHRQLQRAFEADVVAGKRSDNPVNLPLYPYQKQGMLHLAFKGRALLADEMGLGKTVQAIAAAELLRQLGLVKRVLVVSPASLKSEWEEQIHHFCGARAVPVYGPRAGRLRLYAANHAWVLTNYEQVRNDVDDINRLMVPDLVVLDEAQRIKNWPTKTAKTIKRLQSPYAFVLTGTPLENRIEELYSLVEFIDPQVFGSLFRFEREYMEYTEDGTLRPKNLDQLHRVVSSVMLRRRKSDVEDDLPERTDKNFFVQMTKEQRARYSEYEYDVAKLVSILKRRALRKEEHERLQRLLACMRMVCDTPYILDPECRDCPKLDELESILDELLDDPSAKIIVFSEWVRMLNLVKELLDAKGIGYAEHTGKIPQKKRRAQIQRFKTDPACRMFLSTESGGAGLNLQAANIVINLDLPWNPAKLEQRIARAWRKNQKRSVRVVNIVAQNSIEHGMLEKLAYKTALADSVLDGAAFKETPRTENGRNAFAARVGALIAGEPVAAGDVTPSAGAQPDKAADLKGGLLSRCPDSIVGIEANPKTGASVVVARPGSGIDKVRAATELATTAPTVVITPEMKTMLLQLQQMGLLTLSADLQTTYADDGYESLCSKVAALPQLDHEAARSVWATVQPELKASRALADLGLGEQAAAHLQSVLLGIPASLAALHRCDPAQLPQQAPPAQRAIAQRADELLAASPSADNLPAALLLADQTADLIE